ncbi:RDD family protein [Limnobacter humi]|uniref:RDD family protein n=1 Tax=Limnobacter humi TaxID=1778671 RepID=A0ABT1WFG1_9BURK|nr:RDD family protein [Limnobacter humi]MCQ8896254.1 RDD family protein [Limnobacter humi]
MNIRILDHGLISPSRKRRLACMLYETMLLFGVVFIAGYFFDTLTQSKHALYLRHQRQAWLFFVIGLYFVWFWRHGGQTLAMKTWHIKLVNAEGTAVGWGQALFRYLICWPLSLSGLGFIYSWFDPQGQFAQDRLCNTRLVSTKARARGVEEATRV